MLMDYELVIMRDGNKIIQFWGDTVIQHGEVYSQVTLKSLYMIIIIQCVHKTFSLTNHKMVVTNTGQYIAQVFDWRDDRPSSDKEKNRHCNPS